VKRRALAGRERELAQLVCGVEDASRGRGGTILLVGEAGIGKTRLSEELERAAIDRGAEVVWGRAWEAGGAPPFWPWIEVLRAILERSDPALVSSRLGGGRRELAQLVPELAESTPPSSASSVGDRLLLFEAIRGFLSRTASQKPLVIVLEDLHAADASSLLLLGFVAQRAQSARLLVIGTYREVEARSDESMSELLSKVARYAQVIPLGGLDPEAVARLVSESSITVSPVIARRVHEATEGNPLFVDELLRVLEHRKREHVSLDSLPIPDGVSAAIREHLRRLSPTAREALDVCSILGREPSVSVAAAMIAQEPTALAGPLAEAVKLGLLVDLAADRYRFSHVLVREVLHEDLEAGLRAELHRRAAEHLERVSDGDPAAPLAEIAHHLSLGDRAARARAIDYFVRASKRADDQLAYEDAAALVERALELLTVVAPEDRSRRLELLLDLGAALIRSARMEKAHEACRAAARLARDLGSAESFARAALIYGGHLSAGVVDENLIVLLREALSRLEETDGAMRAQVTARLAAALQPAPKPREPIEMAQQAIDMARRVGDRRALLTVLHFGGAAMAEVALPEERLSADEQLLAIGTELGDKISVLRARSRLAFDHLDFGDLDRAKQEAQEYERVARELRQPIHLIRVHLFNSLWAMIEGRFADCERFADEATALAERVEHPLALAYVRAHRWSVARAADRPKQMIEHFSELNVVYRQTPEKDAFIGSHFPRIGDLEGTRLTLSRIPISDDPLLHHSSCAIHLAELCLAAGDVDRARWAYRGYLLRSGLLASTAMSMSCEGPVSRALMLFAIVLEDWEAVDRHYAQSREVCVRINARPLLARLDHELAEALLRRARSEDLPRIDQLASSSRALAASLGMEELVAKIDRSLATPATIPGVVPSIVDREIDEAARTFGGGRYEAIRLLGRGGQKSVYLVRDRVLERECALSLIEGAALDREQTARLRREALVLAKMGSHPHVVTVFDLGEDDGRPFIVSEFMSGGDLAAKLRRSGGTLEIREAIGYVRELLEALAALHERGIVHRDLKPSNVWIGEHGSSKLGDFGLALANDRARLSAEGSLNGTPSYMSPEQLGNRTLDGRSDLYALGCLLYELLTGHPPFTGPLVSVIAQQIHAPVTPPSEHNQEIGAELEGFILKLLSKKPEDRPASARDAIDEIARLDRT
jgi:tetratricopeptide (TPR) repeat protein